MPPNTTTLLSYRRTVTITRSLNESIGILVVCNHGSTPEVISIKSGSPADRAGVEVGNFIFEADGMRFSGTSPDVVVDHLSKLPLKATLEIGGSACAIQDFDTKPMENQVIPLGPQIINANAVKADNADQYLDLNDLSESEKEVENEISGRKNDKYARAVTPTEQYPEIMTRSSVAGPSLQTLPIKTLSSPQGHSTGIEGSNLTTSQCMWELMVDPMELAMRKIGAVKKTAPPITTRPKRPDEVQGREYIFVSQEILSGMKKSCMVSTCVQHRGYDFAVLVHGVRDQALQLSQLGSHECHPTDKCPSRCVKGDKEVNSLSKLSSNSRFSRRLTKLYAPQFFRQHIETPPKNTTQESEA